MKPTLLDIHTHRLPAVAGTAITSTGPDAFVPEPGMYYSVGLHPWQVSESDGGEAFDALCCVVRHPQVLAVGEAGLDRLARAPLDVQWRVLEQQARLADEVGKPLVVHLVRATAELLALRKKLSPCVPWIVHGFRGKPQLADQLLRHGLYLSFGEHCQPEALRAVPTDRLFLETDESPVPIEELLVRAAALRRMEPEELRTVLAANATRCFGVRGGLFFS